MTTTMEMELREKEDVAKDRNILEHKVANNRNKETHWLKKYRHPKWQKRSLIKDVFYQYGSYYS